MVKIWPEFVEICLLNLAYKAILGETHQAIGVTNKRLPQPNYIKFDVKFRQMLYKKAPNKSQLQGKIGKQNTQKK